MIGVFIYVFVYLLGWDIIPFSLAEFKQNTFIKRGDLSNKLANTEQIWVIKANVFMKCVILCAQDQQCLSVFYDNIEKTCRGHSSLYEGPTVSGIINATNTIHWEIKDPYTKLECVPLTKEPGYCIKFHTTKLNWTEQIKACQTDYTNMASLITLDRFDFARNYLFSIGYTSAVSVGASDLSGTWTWQSGDLISNTSNIWGPNEPSNEVGQDCSILAYGISFYLNDGFCDTEKAFLCDKNVYKR